MKTLILGFIFILSAACSMRPSWETAKLRQGRSIASYDDGYYSQQNIESVVEEIKSDDPLGEWRFSARIHKDAYSYTVNRDNKVDSFRIVNNGINRIITRNKLHKSATRIYDVKFADRKRQDIFLHISDIVDEKTAFRTERMILFFPRKYFPAIEALDNDIRVVLPTGEKIYFDKTKKIIQSGPITEEHVDYNLSPEKKSPPLIHYTGIGLTVTLDQRLGREPRFENVARIKHPDHPDECLIASNMLFDQRGRFAFKFATDEKFEEFLSLYCDFKLPVAGEFIP